MYSLLCWDFAVDMLAVAAVAMVHSNRHPHTLPLHAAVAERLWVLHSVPLASLQHCPAFPSSAMRVTQWHDSCRETEREKEKKNVMKTEDDLIATNVLRSCLLHAWILLQPQLFQTRQTLQMHNLMSYLNDVRDISLNAFIPVDTPNRWYPVYYSSSDTAPEVCDSLRNQIIRKFCLHWNGKNRRMKNKKPLNKKLIKSAHFVGLANSHRSRCRWFRILPATA